MAKQFCKALEIHNDEDDYFVYNKETKLLHNNIGPACYFISGLTYIDFIKNGFSEICYLKDEVRNHINKIDFTLVRPSFLLIEKGLVMKAVWAFNEEIKFPEEPTYEDDYIASCHFDKSGIGKLFIPNISYNQVITPFKWLKEAEDFAKKYLGFSLRLKYTEFN